MNQCECESRPVPPSEGLRQPVAATCAKVRPVVKSDEIEFDEQRQVLTDFRQRPAARSPHAPRSIGSGDPGRCAVDRRQDVSKAPNPRRSEPIGRAGHLSVFPQEVAEQLSEVLNGPFRILKRVALSNGLK